jgi:DNA-binding GntR family transcriptional regulator
MSEQEMNEALEEEHAGADELTSDQAAIEDVSRGTEDKKEKPPGFLSYDEWIEKGKDPADFRGENAYKNQYETLKEVRELKGTMTHVVDGIETWKQQQNENMAAQIEQAKIDAQAELDQAKEDEDLAAALAAQDKLNRIANKPAQAIQINPVISDFTKKNPIIDSNSTQYDADFHQDMIMIHNGKLDQLLGGDRSRAGELTAQQIERVQVMAFNQAKELYPDKFVSPRNKRTTTTSPGRRTTQTLNNTKTKLKTASKNRHNPKDDNAANDIYDYIKSKDPEAAETFAKNLIGDDQ